VAEKLFTDRFMDSNHKLSPYVTRIECPEYPKSPDRYWTRIDQGRKTGWTYMVQRLASGLEVPGAEEHVSFSKIEIWYDTSHVVIDDELVSQALGRAMR